MTEADSSAINDRKLGDREMTSLFRSEANSFKENALPTIIIIHPISNITYCLLAFAFIFALLSTLFFGHYTRRLSVNGIIEPNNGFAKIYTSQTGIINNIRVHEGQIVKKGEVLVTASTEKHGIAGNALQTDLVNDSKLRLVLLEKEIKSSAELNIKELETNFFNIQALEHAEAVLKSQLISQTQRTQIAESTRIQSTSLKNSGFISAQQLSQHEAELLDQQIKVDSLKREMMGARADIDRARRERATIKLRGSVLENQLERSAASVQGELSQIASESSWSIVAPSDGIVTTINIAVGQTTSTGSAVASIMPMNSTLRVKLYAPSRALGFIRRGDTVKIKYEAFPYQKFGLATGTVLEIAEVPTSQTELTNNASLLPKFNQAQEPIFAIKVGLEKQYIVAYGKNERLHVGTQLEADILLENRRIFEWLLEPILSFSIK